MAGHTRFNCWPVQQAECTADQLGYNRPAIIASGCDTLTIIAFLPAGVENDTKQSQSLGIHKFTGELSINGSVPVV